MQEESGGGSGPPDAPADQSEVYHAPQKRSDLAILGIDADLDGLIFSFPHGVSPEEVAFAGRTLCRRFAL